MSTTVTRRAARPASIVLLVVGLWLLLAWAVLGYGDSGLAVGAEVVLGVAVLALGALTVREPAPPRGLWAAGGFLGLLLAAMPVVVRYGNADRVEAAYVNSAVCGLLVLGASAWGMRHTPRGT